MHKIASTLMALGIFLTPLASFAEEGIFDRSISRYAFETRLSASPRVSRRALLEYVALTRKANNARNFSTVKTKVAGL